jgi:hypothetical protein
MDEGYKEVYFDKYCKTCKYKKLKEEECPCSECLDAPINYASHKPVKWQEKEAKK